jgi:hypothetical protein
MGHSSIFLLKKLPITIKIRLTDARVITVMRRISGLEKKILFLDMISDRRLPQRRS